MSFNSLEGLARRPTSHTCTYWLELSIAYPTYPEFEHEFIKYCRASFHGLWMLCKLDAHVPENVDVS